LALLLVGFLSQAVSGCGSSSPQRTEVRGKITYGGGNWPTSGTLNFNPMKPAAGFPAVHGIARFGPSGEYEVRSPADNARGLYPGTYRILVECWEVPPTMENPPGKSYVPATFARENEKALTITVPPGPPVVHDFDVAKR
jgi:hypothetical protein